MGYVISLFWISPILRYRRIKRRIASDVNWYAGTVSSASKGLRFDDGARDRLAVIRRNAAELTGTFDDDLPHWYKLVLVRRSEFPAEASGHLMALSNIRNPAHADRRLEKIKTALKLQ